MKLNQHIVTLICPSSSGSLLNDRCSGAFVNEIKRSAFLIIILSVIVVLATGCSSNCPVQVSFGLLRNAEALY
jgi:hypothetical protein